MKAIQALIRVCSGCQCVYGYVLCEEKVECSEQNVFCEMLCNLQVQKTNGFCEGCLDSIRSERKRVA